MNNKGDKKNPKNKQIIIIAILAGLFMVFAISLMNSWITSMTQKEISYNNFIKMLEAGEVSVVYKQEDCIVIKPKGQENSLLEVVYYTGIMEDDDALQTRLQAANEKYGLEYGAEIPDSGSAFLDFILVWVVPIVLMYLLLGLFVRKSSGGGGIMGVGKSNAKIYGQKETGVTFKDVAGQDEAKESMTEIVDFLHNPGRYAKIGAKLPKGALLVGPPGTGKTLLAKAVAGEAKVPFFSLSGSDFVEMFVGVGASRVRDLFKQAQSSAPCIIFIDEIDAIGKSRDSRYGGGNDEREQTLNQLLAEMDGFDTSKGIFILAATNRPDVLDKALLRPGRFDRRIIVDKPDLKGRVEILKVHSKDVLMDDTVDLDEIALATSGAVGSDLANMINEAAILAVKQGRNVVSQADLFESVEVVIAGKEKKDRILGKEEKKTVAYHEVGHALVTALQKDAEPVQKITIVPRTMGSLGYVMQVPEEEKYLMTKDELVARLVTLLGGRAAEEITFKTVTTGASNDIEKATKLARAMITQYGMSDKFGLMSLESLENRYLDGRAVMTCGEATAAEIDAEVMSLLKECHEKAITLLTENKEVLDKISEYLFEKETITGKEFMKIFREVKGIEEPSEETDEAKEADKTDDAAPASENSTPDTVEAETQVSQENPVSDIVEAESESAENPATSDAEN
ncbi:MAG: ATP-dependent zinc metalloprotease FtsH [Lachnospiraceae bacterium]|nr:ATP-dependent zinc metalloprotease FtsH [Lachnospiraceae bacterium]